MIAATSFEVIVQRSVGPPSNIAFEAALTTQSRKLIREPGGSQSGKTPALVASSLDPPHLALSAAGAN